MSDLARIISNGIREIIDSEFDDGHLTARLMGRIDPFLLKNINEPPHPPRGNVDFSSSGIYGDGDIIFTGQEYIFGGRDSPLRFRSKTRKGRGLRYLLEHEGQETSKRELKESPIGWTGIQTGMPYLIDELHYCSWIFEIEKTSASSYKIVRKNWIVDQHGNHPDFEVVETFGDIYFGSDRYYIDSKNRGIYGNMTNGDGQMLLNLCRNIGRDIDLDSSFDGIDRYTQVIVIRGLPYLLAKKIEKYSEHFSLVAISQGWKTSYRLEQRTK